MQSDLEKFVKVLCEMREHLGAFAMVGLGMILVAGIILGFFGLRRIRHGGPKASATHRFFAERREIEGWLRSR